MGIVPTFAGGAGPARAPKHRSKLDPAREVPISLGICPAFLVRFSSYFHLFFALFLVLLKVRDRNVLVGLPTAVSLGSRVHNRRTKQSAKSAYRPVNTVRRRVGYNVH